MSDRTDIWLPADLATRDPIRTRVETVIADWGARWFPRHGARAASFEAISARAASGGSGEGWIIPRKAIGVSCSKAARTRLTGWALDLPVEPVGLTAADAALLEGLQTRLLNDLVDTLEAALDIGDGEKGGPFRRLGGAVVAITDVRGSALLSIAIPFTAVAALCRSALPAASRKPGALAARRAALGSTRVRLEATLGRAEIGLSDLRGLAPGDVLVLNSRTDEPIELALAGSNGVVGHAKLSDVDGRISLTLHA